MSPAFRNRRILHPALAVAGGLAYAAAQPDRGLWWLAPLCLVPLLLGLRDDRRAVRLAIGWLFGTVAGSALVLGPTGYAISRYFEIAIVPAWLAAFAMVQLFGALPFVLFAACVGDTRNETCGRLALRSGSALVVSEFARSLLFTGLPWGLLAYALAPVPALAGSAALGGALLLSFLLAALNACVASLLQRPSSVVSWAVAAGCTIALLLPGWTASDFTDSIRTIESSASGSAEAAGNVRISLVQSAFPAAARRDPTRLRSDLQQLIDASGGPRTDLAVWPESAIVVMLPANAGAVSTALEKQKAARYTLFGAARSEGRQPGSPYNAAFLSAVGTPLEPVHDKVRLVPFAERVPDLMSAAGFGPSPNRAGTGFRSFSIQLANGSAVRVGVLICFESIFPDPARELVKDGAAILVNISNDEWFGATRGMEQHFAASVLRAIETRRPMLRATNTGITAAIDPAGRVRARLAPHDAGALHLSVRPSSESTPFLRFGHWILWLSIAALLIDSGISFSARA